MATWTELQAKADADPDGIHDVEVTGAELREMLIDLPQGPGARWVERVTIHGNGPVVHLVLRDGERMTDGSTAPGAGTTTTVPALHQRHVRNMLSSAPVTAYTDDLEPGQAPPPPALEQRPRWPASMPVGQGWLDGIKWEAPKVETKPDAMDRLIILPGDA